MSVSPGEVSPSPFRSALGSAVERLERSLPEIRAHVERGELPHVTEGGRWRFLPALAGGRWDADRWTHGSWTGGFVAGQLWQASMVSAHEEGLRAEARGILALLEPRAVDRSTHDVGFLFWPSAALGHRATGDPRLLEVGLRAARILLGRRHPAGFLQSWGDVTDPRARGSSAIDTMMNLPLLWWAGDRVPGAVETALSHARATATAYFRGDGTTYHIVRFGDDGEPSDRGTYQGHGPESCWSRGQAWAARGFAEAFLATGEGWLLERAREAIEAFLARLPADGVAPWDFDAPAGDRAPRDASASAIVAGALLRLGRTGGGDAEAWRREGRRLTGLLVEHAMNTGDADGLLLRSSYSVPHGEGVDGATTWGDYFFLESLIEAARPGAALDLLEDASRSIGSGDSPGPPSDAAPPASAAGGEVMGP